MVVLHALGVRPGSSAVLRGSGFALFCQLEPRSMLHVKETPVPRPRFPVIDFHTHVTWSGELSREDKVTFNATPAEMLPVMDRKGIRILVNLTGGYRNGLAEAIRTLQTAHPDRFLVFTEPWWSKAAEPEYARFQAEEIERAHQAGARGIKIMKILGLYLRERLTEGALVKIDDPRFDPMWETAGALGMPTRRLSFCPSTASTSAGRNCTRIQTGPFAARIFRRTGSCRKRAAW